MSQIGKYHIYSSGHKRQLEVKLCDVRLMKSGQYPSITAAWNP